MVTVLQGGGIELNWIMARDKPLEDHFLLPLLLGFLNVSTVECISLTNMNWCDLNVIAPLITVVLVKLFECILDRKLWSFYLVFLNCFEICLVIEGFYFLLYFDVTQSPFSSLSTLLHLIHPLHSLIIIIWHCCHKRYVSCFVTLDQYSNSTLPSSSTITYS